MGVTVKIYIQRPVVREGLGERHRAVSECTSVHAVDMAVEVHVHY